MNARVYSCNDNKTPSISSMREGERERALHITIILIQSPSLSHYNFTVYNAETQIEWNMYVWVCVCLWIQFVLFLFWFWCEVEPLSNTLDWPHEDVRILWLFAVVVNRSIVRSRQEFSAKQCNLFLRLHTFFLLSLIRGDRNELTNQRKSELLRSICSSL